MLDYSKMRMPTALRTTLKRGVLQVQITRTCDLSCTNCTQGSNLAGKPRIATLDQVEEMLISVRDYFGVVGIYGGNPCTHPYFPEVCELVRHHIGFEHRGLFSNNFMGHGKVIRETFNPDICNLNAHGVYSAWAEMVREFPACGMQKGLEDSRHSPPWVAIKDVLDLTQDQRERMIERCDINEFWSAITCVVRDKAVGFFCEIAGAQAMLHENEPDYPNLGVELKDGWWKQPLEVFKPQIDKHCFECGIPLRGRGDLGFGTHEYVSVTHLPIYKLKKPTGKTIHLVSSMEELNGYVPKVTDYVENGANIK